MAADHSKGDPFGGWFDVVASTAGAAASLSGAVHGTKLLVALITTIMNARSNSSLLKSIKADTTALRNKPFKHGIDELQLASSLTLPNARWTYHVNAAESSLREALPLARNSQETAAIEYYTAVANIALSQKDEAIYHINQARTAADMIVNTCVHAAHYTLNDARTVKPETPGIRKVWDNPWWGPATLASGGTLLLAFPLVIKGIGYRVRQDLKDFVSFYNLIQYTQAAISDNSFQANYIALEGPVKPSRNSPAKYRLVNIPAPAVNMQ